MKISLSKGCNENYVAKFVKINKLKKHPNADRLQIATINGLNCIVDLSVKIDDLMIFFPLECSINSMILNSLNLYSNVNLNSNNKIKGGFFNEKGRVKAVKLQGIPSEGFLISILDFDKAVNKICEEIDYTKFIDKEFDTVNSMIICRKYEIDIKSSNLKKMSKSEINSYKYFNNCEQFKRHINTQILTNKLKEINKNQIIDISRKIHGTSGISCRLKFPKKDKFWNKIDNFFNKESVKLYEYKSFCSSRNNIIINTNNNIYNNAHQILLPYLTNGLSIYYEITGYHPSGKLIQNGYDYGCEQPVNNINIYNKNFNINIYRITQTSNDGIIVELDPIQVREWCKKNNFNSVESFYTGSVNELIQNDTTDLSDGEKLLEHIKSTPLYEMETNCKVCKNNVPNEGVVIKVFDSNPIAYKVKCFKFLQKESQTLDLESK